AVADGVDLVGGEQAEQGERDGDADGETDQHVGWGLGTHRHPCQPRQRPHPPAPPSPRCRQRPSGTSVYRTTTSVAAKFITGDGRAQPPQLAPMSTPNGRGRCAFDPSRFSEIMVSSCATITARIRCRNRRSTSSARTSPKPRLRTHKEPRKASACQVTVSPGASSPASHLTAASSRTVTATAGPRRPPPKTMIDRTTSPNKA